MANRLRRSRTTSRPGCSTRAHINQGAHLRGGTVHQGRTTPAPLQGSRLGPERLHLFLDPKHNPAPEGLAKIVFSGQGHDALLFWFPAHRVSANRGAHTTAPNTLLFHPQTWVPSASCCGT